MIAAAFIVTDGGHEKGKGTFLPLILHDRLKAVPETSSTQTRTSLQRKPRGGEDAGLAREKRDRLLLPEEG